MTEQDALRIFGLRPGADPAAIRAAYDDVVGRLRPNEAQAQFLAEARDLLLRQAAEQARAAQEQAAQEQAARPPSAGHPSVPSVPERPQPVALGPAPRATAPASVRFLGLEGAYWHLLIRGSALLAVTLGIYRFWLTTDMRRFLWSNTDVAGETLEYVGTARELLLGFLIAMAILIPLYAVLFIVALSLGTIEQVIAPVSFIVLTVFGQYAVYRARRYRLTRTVYRGVRFHQTGSAWQYAVMAMLWWMLIIITLGLAYPFAQASLERFKMRNTYLGNLGGRFQGSAGRLFLRGFLMWVAVIAPLIGSIVAIGYAAARFDAALLDEVIRSGDADAITRFATEHPGFAAAVAAAVGALVWSFLAALLLYPVFQAMLLRWWVSGLRFGDVTLTSELRTGQVYGAYLAFIGWSMVLGMAFSIFGGICLALVVLIMREDSRESVEMIATLILVGSYVAVALGYSALYQVKVKFGLWRIVADSVALTNAGTLQKVTAVGASASPVGEGLADALNVGGF